MMAKVYFWKIDTKKRNATNPSEEHGSYISSIIILDEKSWSSTDILSNTKLQPICFLISTINTSPRYILYTKTVFA